MVLANIAFDVLESKRYKFLYKIYFCRNLPNVMCHLCQNSTTLFAVNGWLKFNVNFKLTSLAKPNAIKL